jgi:hypothetical protein
MKGDTQDAELKKMYEDFGDVNKLLFSEWWRKHGRLLFAEQVRFPEVKLITEESNDISPNPTNYMVVEIPLNLTERTISRQLLAILRAHPNRAVKRVSHAIRPLEKLRGIRMDVIGDAHYVWSLNRLVEMAKQDNSTIGKPFDTMTSQQIGIFIRLVSSCMPKATDGEVLERKKRNGMKVAVSRMLQRANALIANAEIGIFPSVDPVALRKRWTKQQQLELDAAVARGEWMPNSVDETRFRQRLNRPKLPT